MKRTRLLLQQNSVAHYRTSLLRELSAHEGLELHVVADTRSETAFMTAVESTESLGCTFHLARVTSFRITDRATLFWQPDAVVAAWRVRPDVIIGVGSPYSVTSWALLLLGRITNAPVLLWTHGLLVPEKGPKWLIRSLQYRLASGLLLYGERSRDLLARQGMTEERLHVVFNSLGVTKDEQARLEVSTEAKSALRREWGISEEEHVLIFVGRLQRRKRLDRLLTLVHGLRDANCRVHALVVGEGEDRTHLERLATDLQVRAVVHFLGESRDETKLADCFGISDLCVIPSGPGLTVIHAMSYGVPVLTTNDVGDQYPEAEAIEDGVNGFLCPMDDAVATLRKTKEVLRELRSRRDIAKLCRQTIARRYTPKHQAQNMLSAIRSVLEKPS